MKIGKLFWGGFLLSSGIVLLLGNFNLVDFGDFEWFKIAPAALILIGIAVLFPKDNIKAVIAALSGIFLGATLFAGIHSGCNNTHWHIGKSSHNHVNNDKIETEHFSVNIDSAIQSAEATIRLGAGELIIEGNAKDLFSATVNSNIADYELRDTIVNKTHTLWFEPKDSDISVSAFDKNKNKANLQLSNNVLWKLNVDAGAADVNLDMTKIRLESLDIDAGAAEVDVTLGDLQERIDVNYDGGASAITFRVPRNLGCEIKINHALSDFKQDGFIEKSDGLYQTDNFMSTAKKAFLNIDVGVSSVQIVRY